MKDQLLTGGLSGLRRTGALLIAVIGLGACDPTTTAVVAGASLATLIHTDKTLLDHAASYATDEDCSILHSAHNEAYCQPPASDTPDALMAMMATHYCYRTLGGVSCYDRPDYMASSQTRIDYGYGLGTPGEPGPLAALPDHMPPASY